MDLWLVILLIVVALVVIAAVVVAVQRSKRGRLLVTQTGRRDEGGRP
jgi:preprotein translocase subunit SecG